MLRIKHFSVFHYKSIRDSGRCYINTPITVFAGKNESGKTAILEALRDFHPEEREIQPDAYPIDSQGQNPKIEVTFSAEPSDLDLIEQAAGFPIPASVKSRLLIDGISLNYDSTDGYSIDPELSQTVAEVPRAPLPIPDDLWNRLQKLSQTLSIDPPALRDPNPSAESILVASEQVIGLATPAISRLSAGTPSRSAAERSLREIEAIDNEARRSNADKLINAIKSIVPRFVYFSDFKNLLPPEISIQEAAKNSAIQDFITVSGLPESIFDGKRTGVALRNILKSRSATLTKKFNETYNQDRLFISAEVDGTKLRFGIEEDGGTSLFRIDQRSRGFQWFISFYLKLQSLSTEKGVIWLLDEPGLFLHAKAQHDVLKFLERLTADGRAQVLYCTHSPYLIDPRQLGRVRVVVKRKEAGTVIENKVHKGSDIDTLTPIMTAIGFDPTLSLGPGSQSQVVVEGMSDYFYLTAFQSLLKPEFDHLRFLPAVGATKTGVLVSLCIGWNLQFCVLLDADREGESTRRSLLADGIDQGRIVSVSTSANETIESVIGLDLINRIANGDDSDDRDGGIRPHGSRRHGGDKVLVSNKFFIKVSSGSASIDPATIERMKSLLVRIADALRASSPAHTRPSPELKVVVSRAGHARADQAPGGRPATQ